MISINTMYLDEKADKIRKSIDRLERWQDPERSTVGLEFDPTLLELSWIETNAEAIMQETAKLRERLKYTGRCGPKWHAPECVPEDNCPFQTKDEAAGEARKARIIQAMRIDNS
jgi:hypothetical protein